MNVSFSQIYMVPGVDFPLSHSFQHRISKDVSRSIKSSATFLKRYGAEFELVFNVSAKPRIRTSKICGPSVSKKTKRVDYTIFLPFDAILRHADAPRVAVKSLLEAVCDVLVRLEIDTARLVARQNAIIEGICSDPKMLEEPNWDEEDNETRVRKAFEAFFTKK